LSVAFASATSRRRWRHRPPSHDLDRGLSGPSWRCVRASSWRASSPAPQLRVFVTLRVDGVQVTNDTDAEWDRCEVAVQGGFVAPVPTLYPRGTIRFAYGDFRRDGMAVPESEGVFRAKQQTEITCSGTNGARQRAALSFP
jgi:hypothetical protein